MSKEKILKHQRRLRIFKNWLFVDNNMLEKRKKNIWELHN